MTRVSLFCFALALAGCDTPQQPAVSANILPEPASEGAQVMKKFCSDCHAPPSPATHTAEEWPNVVYRMQERRRMKAYQMMDEHEHALLLDYLIKFAKG